MPMHAMHMRWGSRPDMEAPHDAGHRRDTASLAFGSDPLVGVAGEGIPQSSLAVMRSLYSGCFGSANKLMCTVPW